MLIALSSVGIQYIVDDAVGIAHVAANFIDYEHVGLHIINNGAQCCVFGIQIVGTGVTASRTLFGVKQQVVVHHPDGLRLGEAKGYQQ